MQYRKFGKTGDEVSVLGFGCMRFPLLDDDSKHIDEVKSSAMLQYALDHGVTYYDTAYPYHGGASEVFVGKFFKKTGARDQVKIATKLPCWMVEKSDDFDRLLDEQLDRLQTGYIDYYLLHALNKDSWTKVHDLGVLEWAEQKQAEGKIRHLGFSFHDDHETFIKIIDAYDWDFCQIQYNYIDIENQAGMKGLQYAGSKGIAVVVMEPILGGRLVNPPTEVQALWDQAPIKRSAADWALQWLWDQPEVTVVLSGMSAMEHVVENVKSADMAKVDLFSTAEKALVMNVREKYQALSPIPCTDCKYCLPCEVDLQIPRLFSMFNNARMYNTLDETREHYARMEPEKRAESCIECRQCEEKCPQHIVISEMMQHVDAVLSGRSTFQEVM